MKKTILITLLCLIFTLLPTAALAAGQFSDVGAKDYCAKPVDWAVKQGITNGTSSSTFSPNATCTRAQILTFLWRAAGSPEPSYSGSYYYDVSTDDYFCKASTWATENGMLDTDGVYFRPDTPCTRAATVEFFWRYACCPGAEYISFKDVSYDANYAQAVSWAVGYGITNGTGDGTSFSPNDICTRGQIATFLYRYFVEPLDVTVPITPAVPAAPTVPADTSKLDPLPPVDYTRQPDWYMTLTPAHTMSNARLVAEYEQIVKVIDERRAQGIYMSDGPYSRELDLWSQLSQRCDIIKSYERGMKYGDPAPWVIEEYNDLIAKYGDITPLRKYI